MPCCISSEIKRNGFTSSNIASSRNTSGGLTESVLFLIGSDGSSSTFGRRNKSVGTGGAVSGLGFEKVGSGGGFGADNEGLTVAEDTTDIGKVFGFAPNVFGFGANIPEPEDANGFNFGATDSFGLKRNGGGFGAVKGGVFFNCL